MGNLLPENVQTKNMDEVRAANVATVRKWYNELVDVFSRIMDGRYIRCPKCGKYMPADAFYLDDRYVFGRFYFCKRCVQNIVEQRDKPTQEPRECKESVQKALQLMDLPYIDSLYENCVKTVSENINVRVKKSPFTQYMVTIRAIPTYKNLTWKDSIFPVEQTKDMAEDPADRTIRIFGRGFSNEDYEYLQHEYDDWCSRTEVDTKSQETYVTQICLQSLDIHKDRRAGRDVSAKLTALDKLMSSANLQPKQNVNNAATDSLTFGQLIEKWENSEPIPEPDEEFKDVDGIGKYIRVFFSGHLARAVGLKNAFSKEYNDYIDQYTVQKPGLDDEEENEDIYTEIFGSGGE